MDPGPADSGPGPQHTRMGRTRRGTPAPSSLGADGTGPLPGLATEKGRGVGLRTGQCRMDAVDLLAMGGIQTVGDPTRCCGIGPVEGPEPLAVVPDHGIPRSGDPAGEPRSIVRRAADGSGQGDPRAMKASNPAQPAHVGKGPGQSVGLPAGRDRSTRQDHPWHGKDFAESELPRGGEPAPTSQTNRKAMVARNPGSRNLSAARLADVIFRNEARNTPRHGRAFAPRTEKRHHTS